MNKKLFTQIKNEWHSNLWIMAELLLVSVIMWFIVDYIYVKVSIYEQPRGFDISHCYLLDIDKLSEKSPNYNANLKEETDEVNELINRLQRYPEIEAVSLSHWSYPYDGSNSNCNIACDTMKNDDYIYKRIITPDFFRVFQYRGTRGETPEQLAAMLKNNTFIASGNIFKQKYNIKFSSLIGKQFHFDGDTTTALKLAAAYLPVKNTDYEEAYSSKSVAFLLEKKDQNSKNELCIRVRAKEDKNFIPKLWKDCSKQLRIGNIYISQIRSFSDIRHNYQQIETNDMRNYLFGMGFLLLNIFFGLLGTFWFRTQQRRGEIALFKALGSTQASIFIRLLSEGILLLAIITVPAVIIDWNLAHAELNQAMNGTTLAAPRFIFTIMITFLLIALMIVAGNWFPARKAMKIQPAEALHEE